jgi:hypothetical protein
MGDKRLTKRLTIPMTSKMAEDINALSDRLGVRPVDVGRMALVEYLLNLEMWCEITKGLEWVITTPVEEEEDEEPPGKVWPRDYREGG